MVAMSSCLETPSSAGGWVGAGVVDSTAVAVGYGVYVGSGAAVDGVVLSGSSQAMANAITMSAAKPIARIKKPPHGTGCECLRRFLPAQGHSGAQSAPRGSSRVSRARLPVQVIRRKRSYLITGKVPRANGTSEGGLVRVGERNGARLWIPAFAGMTVWGYRNDGGLLA